LARKISSFQKIKGTRINVISEVSGRTKMGTISYRKRKGKIA